MCSPRWGGYSRVHRTGWAPGAGRLLVGDCRLGVGVHRLAVVAHRLVEVVHRLVVVEHRLVVVVHRLAVVEHSLMVVEHRLEVVEHRLVVVAHKPEVEDCRLVPEPRTLSEFQKCPRGCLRCLAWDSLSPRGQAHDGPGLPWIQSE